MKKTQTILLLFLLTAIALATALIGLQTPHKRYAVFAGYNADGTIPPYVITYLKALNEVADGVVYIADSPLKAGEEKKLKDLTIYTQHIRHNEYDWGSYKQGYNWLKRNGYLKTAKELIFANDSTYAPLGGSFKPLFEKMDKKTELDFWGNSQNTAFNPHVQSYFMVIRHPVFSHPKFRSFLNAVRHREYSFEYVHYEITFTEEMEKLGFKWDSYIDYANFPFAQQDITDINSYPLTAIRDFNHLFLKRRTFTTNLLILENISELLRYIAKTYPESYQDIATDIPPRFLPLKGETDTPRCRWRCHQSTDRTAQPLPPSPRYPHRRHWIATSRSALLAMTRTFVIASAQRQLHIPKQSTDRTAQPLPTAGTSLPPRRGRTLSLLPSPWRGRV